MQGRDEQGEEMKVKDTGTRYTADTIADASETVRLLHTLIARGAADLMTRDERIKPVGAVTALMDDLFQRLSADAPHVMAVYRRALAKLGIGRGDMDYRRFMSYVDARERARLFTDVKVAGT
jgi:hypothetical protein